MYCCLKKPYTNKGPDDPIRLDSSVTLYIFIEIGGFCLVDVIKLLVDDIKI